MKGEQSFLSGSGSPHRVTCISWNSEGSNLAVGLQHGFIIYSTEVLLGDDGWLREVVRRTVIGGVGVIALHGQGNLVVTAGWAVGHRASVRIHNLLVDDDQDDTRSLLAQVVMPAAVNAIRFHPHLVAVGLGSGAVHLFNQTLQEVESFEVARGVKGSATENVMAMATMLAEHTASGMSLSLLRMVILGPTAGSVRCIRYVCEQRIQSSLLMSSFRDLVKTGTQPLKSKVLELHRHTIRCIAITPDGGRAITVSERGTALKLLDVDKGVVICQFSRGTTPNVVHTLSLFVSANDTVAACVTDTGTLHLFHLPSAGISNRTAPETVDTESAPNGYAVVRAWTEYCKSVSARARLRIPDDALYESANESQVISKATYSIILRPVAKKASCLANVVHWGKSPNGVAKARLLCIQVDLAPGKKASMNVARSFYFPKDELA